MSAEACVDSVINFDESSITRRCISSTTALASASAMARAWNRGFCGPTPQICVDKCLEYDSLREECEAACTESFNRKLELDVDVAASITTSNEQSCSGDITGNGNVWFFENSDGVRAPTRSSLCSSLSALLLCLL